MADGSSRLTVETLSTLLGIAEPDATVQTRLEFALEDVKDTVKNYCHIDRIPEGLETTVLRMAVDLYRNEQLGSADIPQTVASVSMGDTSTSFSTANSNSADGSALIKKYKASLNRYRKVEFT